MKLFAKGYGLQNYISRSGDVLFLEIEKYTKARELAFNHAPVKKLYTFETISKIKRQLDFNRYSSHENICRLALKLEADLRLLIPHPASRFHAGATKKVDAIIQYAHSYLNQ